MSAYDPPPADTYVCPDCMWVCSGPPRYALARARAHYIARGHMPSPQPLGNGEEQP